MINDEAVAGQFCWVDLAATDVGGARHFYEKLFGWSAREQPANGGFFTRLKASDRDVGSMYQLGRAHIDSGVPSHWTPYIRVNDVEAMARRAVRYGGQITVKPFLVSGMARIGLILDSVGAPVGLWEPLGGDTAATNEREDVDG